MSTAERMRQDWDERAERDARFFIASGTADAGSFWRSGEEELLALILSDVDLGRTAEALEIGCGIGRLVRPLAERVANVIGVDISPRMIAEARRACEGMRNVRLETADGTLSGVPDQSRDFVFSYIVFQHIPERAAIETYVREASRVLRPGGVFHFQVDGRVRRRGRYEPNTYEGITLDAGEVRTLVEAAGLSVVRQWGDGTHYLWTTSAFPGISAAVQVVPRIVDRIEVDGLKTRLANSCGEPIPVDDLAAIRLAIEPFIARYAIRGSEEFVEETFRVLLGREPLAPERDYNRGVLERGLETAEDWIDTIVTSAELRARLTPLVPRLSAPAEERLRNRLRTGPGESLGAVMMGIVERLHGLRDDVAVREAYDLILGREPEMERQAYFTKKLELGHFTRMKVLTELLVSDELRPPR